MYQKLLPFCYSLITLFLSVQLDSFRLGRDLLFLLLFSEKVCESECLLKFSSLRSSKLFEQSQVLNFLILDGIILINRNAYANIRSYLSPIICFEVFQSTLNCRELIGCSQQLYYQVLKIYFMSTQNNSKLNQIKCKYGYTYQNNDSTLKKQYQRQTFKPQTFGNERLRNSRKMLSNRDEEDMKFRVLSIFSNVQLPKSNQMPIQDHYNEEAEYQRHLLISPQTFRQPPLNELQASYNNPNFRQDYSYNSTQKQRNDSFQNYRKTIPSSIQQGIMTSKKSVQRLQQKGEWYSDRFIRGDENEGELGGRLVSERGKQIIRPKRCSPLEGIDLSLRSNMQKQIGKINKLQKRIQSMLKGQAMMR